jgi:tetratricopeptide (TPR) repeat protein
MRTVSLIVFGALFAPGQVRGPWEGLSRIADQRQETDHLAEAETLRREALLLAEQELGPADKQLVSLLAKLATLLNREGHASDAEPVARRAYIIADQAGDRRLIGVALNALGVVLVGEGEEARAEPVMRRSLALLEESEGPDSLDVAKAANNLASLYSEAHEYAKAEQLLRRALTVYEKHFGPDHPATALLLANMFALLTEENRAAEGETYLRRALAIGEKAFPHSLEMAHLQLCLASFEANHRNYKEAARLIEEVIATQERLLGPEHPDLGRTLSGYSSVLRSLHQKTEAKLAQNRANMILKSALPYVK